MDWNTGLVLISIICFFLGMALIKVKQMAARILLIIFVPYLLSLGLYWFIAFIEGPTSEHGDWSGIFIHPWTIAGVSFMSVGLFVFSRYVIKKG